MMLYWLWKNLKRIEGECVSMYVCTYWESVDGSERGREWANAMEDVGLQEGKQESVSADSSCKVSGQLSASSKFPQRGREQKEAGP